MRNPIACFLLAFALTACAGGEKPEPTPVAEQPAPAPEKPNPLLVGAPGFAVASLAPGRTGCTAEGARSRAIVGIQTEAMMTALACGPRFGKPGAYADYRRMTAVNAELFAAATRELMSEYGKGKEGTRKFDTEHTRVSNLVAMSANGDKQFAYCDPRREWFEALLAADRDTLYQHAGLVADRMCSDQLAAEAAAKALVQQTAAKPPQVEKAKAGKAKAVSTGKKPTAAKPRSS